MSGALLIISAMDSSGAAGMPVDIRVAESLGMPVRCVVTALTVQGDGGVIDILPAGRGSVRAAMESAIGDPPGICSIKIGVLAAAEVASEVAHVLAGVVARGVPVVVDPVIRASSDHSLTDDQGAGILVKEILPLSTVATPNRQELAYLNRYLGGKRRDETSVETLILQEGAGALLVTDGEGDGETCRDILYLPEGKSENYPHPRMGGPVPRGTGCALSTAIAANLGMGLEVPEAVRRGIDYVAGLIEGSTLIGNQRLLFPKNRPTSNVQRPT